MAKTGVAIRQPVGTERHVPGIHSVQGINSHVNDIRLRGESFIAMIGDAVVKATLVRRIVGASELVVTVLDPEPARRLLRSPLLEEAHELILDGLHWKLVKVANEGQDQPLTLTYEPLIVYLLKQLKGPNKAFRDLMTRAEFAQARAYEAKPRPHFIAPELHVVQDIASPEQAKPARKKAEESRGKGIGQNPDLKINGRPATKAQVDILDRMLRVGESKGANTKVMESMVVTCIDESYVGALSPNLMQQEPFTNPNDDDTNPEDAANGYLAGWNGGIGAIEFNRSNPEAPVAEICTNVQGNRDGASPYERFLDEGRAWVAAYGGGSDVTTASTERYAFQQSKTESNWKVMNRLAAEVRWRCFESASWIYFLDEPTLLRSPRRMRVSDVAPGIIDTTFDYDIGKEVTEVTVECLAKTWAAPPGSVASVSRHGPANGLYLVEEIESKPSGRKGIANVTLKRPTEPLPEPRPKVNRSSVGFGGSSGAAGPSDAPANVARAVAAMLAEIEATDGTFTYKWGGGHASVAQIKERLKGWDCSGYVSHILWAGGLLDEPLVSGALAGKYQPGEGKWLTIYANSQHVFGKIWTPDGNKYFECGGAGSTGWAEGSPSTSGFSARHPEGF